jgi:hypothetical protein
MKIRPSVGVAVIIIKNGKVLLENEKVHMDQDHGFFPVVIWK